ncbi:hypothetical protein GOFOIKOB_2435 [Methylobacterium tardum]|uniref:Uncharacterized protein n=1 Tax=Methylobacterium tardum TaxID=374432 RepID=A0AA37WPG0_9HYPH|nr:hypothetical protein GOFOIKOB_2435 [Methylobacterium tardum]GLS68905.1 hypothetical protein GCM10007890_09170 [Methylobacterium tardum]
MVSVRIGLTDSVSQAPRQPGRECVMYSDWRGICPRPDTGPGACAAVAPIPSAHGSDSLDQSSTRDGNRSVRLPEHAERSRSTPSFRGRAAEPGIQNRRRVKGWHNLRVWIPGSPAAPRNDGAEDRAPQPTWRRCPPRAPGTACMARMKAAMRGAITAR